MKNRDGDAENAKSWDLIWFSPKLKTHFCHPFRFVKKDWIVAQYHLYNILDLYYTTRSCEGDINHNPAVSDVVKDFTKYTLGMEVPVCNECWWCDERQWAEQRVPEMIKEIDEF